MDDHSGYHSELIYEYSEQTDYEYNNPVVESVVKYVIKPVSESIQESKTDTIQLLDDNEASSSCIICLNSIDIETEVWLCPQCNIHIHNICIDTWNEHAATCPHCKYNIEDTEHSHEHNNEQHVIIYGLRYNIDSIEKIRTVCKCILYILCFISCVFIIMGIYFMYVDIYPHFIYNISTYKLNDNNNVDVWSSLILFNPK